MEDGIPTVSIDEVCSRTLDQPRYCQQRNPRLPIEERCDNLVRAGYIPKGCDGAYMAPQARRDFCDAINQAGEAYPHFCFVAGEERRLASGRRRGWGGERILPLIAIAYAADAVGKAITKKDQGRK